MKAGIYVAGSAAGAAIPLILREYVDKPTPPTTGVTFDWKKPSVYVGLGGGAVMTIAGLFFGHKLSPLLEDLFISAGPAMMVTGAYSAMFPKSGGSTTALRAPAFRLAPAGTVRTRTSAVKTGSAKIY